MNVMDIARRYVDAWNARDTTRLAASFREGGTYEDPNTGGPIGTGGLSAYAAALFAAFPDLTFEDAGMRRVSESELQFAWIMKGTNRGSLRGLPPTGASIALPGLDLIKVCDDGVAQVRGYFDRQSLMEQLGLQVAVQPFSAGPIRFGICTQVRSESRRRGLHRHLRAQGEGSVCRHPLPPGHEMLPEMRRHLHPRRHPVLERSVRQRAMQPGGLRPRGILLQRELQPLRRAGTGVHAGDLPADG